MEYETAGLWKRDLADLLEFTLLGSAEKLTSADKTSIDEGLTALNESLTFSTHPVGYTFTVADLSLWGAIKGNPLITPDIASGKYPEVQRWYKEIMEQQPITTEVNKFMKELNAVSSDAGRG